MELFKQKSTKEIKSRKTEKGITLIALIVIIIVLLILSAISIAMLTGQNGILDKAAEGKSTTVIAEEKEIVSFIGMEAMMELPYGQITRTNLEKAIQSQKRSREIEIKNETDTEFIILFTDTKREYTINKTGESEDEGLTKTTDPTPGDFEGDGTEDNPYIIQSIEDVVALSRNVSPDKNDEDSSTKTYNHYEGKIFKFLITLDFNERDSYVNPDRIDFGDVNGDGVLQTLIEEVTTGEGFKAIGEYSHTFKGTIDGNNKQLRNLYMNNTRDYQGFIGYAMGNNVVVKNLNFKNVNIKTNSYSAVIIGRSDASNTTVENCTVTGNLQFGSYSGAIVGQAKNNVTLNKNVNKAAIKIAIRGDSCGGIIGDIESPQNINVDNCINTGKIEATETSNIGGIIGYMDSCTANVTNCHNTANITAQNEMGGIIGATGSSSTLLLRIENCYNTGNITGNGTYVAGIVGDLYQSADIIGCYNTGNIEGKTNYVAGISGRGPYNINVENSYNKGTIKNDGTCGGIIGKCEGVSNITKCYNNGEIICNSNSSGCGGIIGADSGASGATISKCYNTGYITQNGTGLGIGGITGNGFKDINNCYNTGKIFSNGGRVGGIVGLSMSGGTKLENIYNIGEIETTSTSNEIGGIVGYLNSSEISFKNAYNFKPILSGIDSVGSIGYLYINSMEKIYYLKGTGNVGNTCETGANTAQEIETEANLKTLLKTDLLSVEGWKEDTNTGYPILDF